MAPGEKIDVEAGDIIGLWYGAGAGVIDFDYEDMEVVWVGTGIAYIPTVGDKISFAPLDPNYTDDSREYSIAANYDPVPEPATLLLLGAGLNPGHPWQGIC